MRVPFGRNILPAVFLLLFSSCELIEFSPNHAVLPDNLKGLTVKNLARMQTLPEKDTLRIALTGDSQRYYKDAADMIADINQRDDIDFLIHTGDFTDFGINREFVWMGEAFNSLDIPWLVAVGNHDLIGNGPEIYENMFGSENFFFDKGPFRFLFYDSNSRESGFNGNVPDINWMTERSSEKQITIGVCHVPPYSQDFDQSLMGHYHHALENEVQSSMIIHGHHHDYYTGTLEGTDIEFINTASCSKRKYIILEISGQGHRHEIVHF